MPVTQVLLKVSAVNDVAQAVSVDVTSNILSAGKTVYSVGAASTTRWYFVQLTDGAGNTSTFPLGSYTTAAPAAQTIEANRALVTSDPVYVSGTGTVSGTDVVLATGQNFIVKLSSTPSLPITLGFRLKFANTTAFTTTDTAADHHLMLRLFGDVTADSVYVYFNLLNLSAAVYPSVRWTNRNAASQLISDQPATIMKTGYFWVFLTGTPGGALTFRAFDTDDATLTASSTCAGVMPAMVGDLRARCYNYFKGTPSNAVTVDKLWYRPAADYAVTPASTAA